MSKHPMPWTASPIHNDDGELSGISQLHDADGKPFQVVYDAVAATIVALTNLKVETEEIVNEIEAYQAWAKSNGKTNSVLERIGREASKALDALEALQ